MQDLSDAGMAITATGLRKSYGNTVVLNDIDLAVPAGSVFALLGPNGAGKTTTVEILTTLIPPDAGRVSIVGHDLATDPDGIRRVIGVTGQFSAVDDLLTGRENLRLMADLRHLGRTEGKRITGDLLAHFALDEAADRLPSTYSGGMRRRLDLAMTLVARPQVVFLDEPTTGLDPRSRRDMWSVIEALVADGVTVLLTTQYLEEADRLADRVAVLDRGVVVAEGSPAELKSRIAGGRVSLQFAEPAGLAAAIPVVAGVGDVTTDEAALTLHVAGDGGVKRVKLLLDRLEAAHVEVASLAVHTPDLDDVFLALTGSPQPAVV